MNIITRENIIKRQGRKPSTLYSMETQGKEHQQGTKYRMSRHMTFKITRGHLNDYPPHILILQIVSFNIQMIE